MVDNSKVNMGTNPKVPPTMPQKKIVVPSKSEAKNAPSIKVPPVIPVAPKPQSANTKKVQSVETKVVQGVPEQKTQDKNVSVSKQEINTDNKITAKKIEYDKPQETGKIENKEKLKTSIEEKKEVKPMSFDNSKEELKKNNKKNKIIRLVVSIAVAVLIIGLICSVLFITPASKLVEKTLSFIN